MERWWYLRRLQIYRSVIHIQDSDRILRFWKAIKVNSRNIRFMSKKLSGNGCLHVYHQPTQRTAKWCCIVANDELGSIFLREPSALGPPAVLLGLIQIKWGGCSFHVRANQGVKVSQFNHPNQKKVLGAKKQGKCKLSCFLCFPVIQSNIQLHWVQISQLVREYTSNTNVLVATYTYTAVKDDRSLDIYCTSVRPGRGIPHMWLSLRFLLSFYLLKGFF